MIQAGCEKDPGNGTPSGEIDPRDVEATANAVIATGAGQYNWKWKNGESVSVYTTGASSNSNVQFILSSVAASGTSGMLSGKIRQTATGVHTFAAAYPYSQSGAANPAKYVIDVPASQNTTTDGIDPAAYVLVGVPVAKDIPATGDIQLGEMKFSSPLAVAKLSFTSQFPFADDEKVTGIRFYVDREPDIAGLAYYDLTGTTSKPDIFAPSGSSILLSYPDGAGPSAAGAFDAWFTSFPFTIAAGETYTITVYTNVQAVKGTVTAGQKIQFAAGGVATLNVAINQDFKTDTPLAGKTWIELPDKISGDGLRGKAYHTTMKDNKTGRNYSVLFDMSEKLALWVAYPINKNVHLGSISRNENWQYDDSGDIPISAQPNIISGTYGTYDTDHMDRGHQIASADRNGTLSAMHQTYMTTNVTPQYNKLNQGAWVGLETAIRTLAVNTTVNQDTLYVVTGPLLNSAAPRYINDKSNRPCRVPDGYFKVILWSKYDSGTASRKYDSVGFIWPQNYADNQNQGAYVNFQTSVSAVEQETGYTFFGNIDGLASAQLSTVKSSTTTWNSFANRSTNPSY